MLPFFRAGLVLACITGTPTSLAEPPDPPETCGQLEPTDPLVPHWIDGCGPGPQLDSFPGTLAKVLLDLDLDGEEDRILTFAGPAEVERSGPLDDSGHFPGSAPVDGHLEVLDTELLSMNGFCGDNQLEIGQQYGLPPSFGAIVESPVDPTSACSFFHNYARFTLPDDGLVLYNHDPFLVVAGITGVPPENTQYYHCPFRPCEPPPAALTGIPTDPIPLYASPDPDDPGPVVAQVLDGVVNDECVVGHDTPIELVSLDAFTDSVSGSVRLEWRTGFEVRNLGFHVYRQRGTEVERLTPAPIAGSALSFGLDARL
ncbi:MAG: hypothetical protein MI919_30190, partial [Holophagales bacterium]|nr:hypothetical protein [Holophagales bacterium]